MWAVGVARRGAPPGAAGGCGAPARGRGTERVSPPVAAASSRALPDQALRQLAELGVAIERHFGAPQDVEWAWAGGEVFILQARPITALPEPPPRAGRAQRQMARLVAELLPARPYPLEATIWGFDYFSSSLLRPILRPLGLAVHFDRMFVEEEGVVVRFTGRLPYRVTPGLLLAPLRLLRLARRFDPARWRSDPLLAEVQARARALETKDLGALSWAGVNETVHQALAIPLLVGQLRMRYQLPRLPAVGALRLLLSLLGARDRFGTILFAGLETRTLDANRALEALAARIRSDPTLADTFARHEPAALWTALEAHPSGRAVLAELRSFLDEYGHREVGGTLQVSHPTWRDAPEVVLGMLQGLARTPPKRRPQRPAWAVARDELLTHPLLRLPPLRSAFVRLLDDAPWFHQIREDTRFYLTLVLPVLRRTVLELGRRLVDTGVLDAAPDVFYLKLGELERIDGAWPPPPPLVGELRELVARRKATYAELESVPLVDPRLLGRAETTDARDALLRGIPGSPGVAEGPVCVVRGSTEFGKLRPGRCSSPPTPIPPGPRSSSWQRRLWSIPVRLSRTRPSWRARTATRR